MVFNRKEVFRHDFGSEGAKPAAIAIKPAANAVKTEAVKTTAAKPAEKPGAANQPASAGESTSTLTTAEAIAAELRAAQEALPAPTNATFAPDCLNPANAIPTARRRAGANLSGFKSIAKGMFKN
jgi:hypothetical protein